MASSLNYLSDDVLRRAIDRMDMEFDSHDLIVDVMTNEPTPYIQELNDHVDEKDPFERLHQKIGESLKVFVPVKIVKTKRVFSANIFGRVNENQGWRKV